MATKKKVTKTAPPADDALADAAPAVDTDGKTAVTVVWNGESRVYSEEVHGPDFKALAKEFAEKKGGKVV